MFLFCQPSCTYFSFCEALAICFRNYVLFCRRVAAFRDTVHCEQSSIDGDVFRRHKRRFGRRQGLHSIVVGCRVLMSDSGSVGRGPWVARGEPVRTAVCSHSASSCRRVNSSSSRRSENFSSSFQTVKSTCARL